MGMRDKGGWTGEGRGSGRNEEHWRHFPPAQAEDGGTAPTDYEGIFVFIMQ